MSVILNGVSIQTASERKLSFKEHRTNGHDGSGLFKCTQCEKSFLSHKQLTHHNWDHKARKTFLNCEICDKKYGTDVHHLQYQNRSDSNGYIGTFHKNKLGNLINVCKECHDKIHNYLRCENSSV